MLFGLLIKKLDYKKIFLSYLFILFYQGTNKGLVDEDQMTPHVVSTNL